MNVCVPYDLVSPFSNYILSILICEMGFQKYQIFFLEPFDLNPLAILSRYVGVRIELKV